MVSQRCEGLVHINPQPFCDDSLGLLDRNAALEGVVELIDDDVGLAGSEKSVIRKVETNFSEMTGHFLQMYRSKPESTEVPLAMALESLWLI